VATQLIKRYIKEFASWLRNQEDYCDWTVGMEPIPGDRTWIQTKYKCKNKFCSCRIK